MSAQLSRNGRISHLIFSNLTIILGLPARQIFLALSPFSDRLSASSA